MRVFASPFATDALSWEDYHERNCYTIIVEPLSEYNFLSRNPLTSFTTRNNSQAQVIRREPGRFRSLNAHSDRNHIKQTQSAIAIPVARCGFIGDRISDTLLRARGVDIHRRGKLAHLLEMFSKRSLTG